MCPLAILSNGTIFILSLVEAAGGPLDGVGLEGVHLPLGRVDLGLHLALAFALPVVLGVFAQVTFGAGLSDLLGDLRHLDVFELVDFGLDLAVPRLGHRDVVAHQFHHSITKQGDPHKTWRPR